ncbi:hypothetical protein AAF712_006487 [Marasmius tenuissimus]|uniref:CHAT domain-containing protein n=1 Tax=Marasmius tenuissimus TaxID=585030 RepID=A0ABR2ZYM7_9AGAR
MSLSFSNASPLSNQDSASGEEVSLSKGFSRLVEKTVDFAFRTFCASQTQQQRSAADSNSNSVEDGVGGENAQTPADVSQSVQRAKETMELFESSYDIKYCNDAISILETHLDHTSANAMGRHVLLYNLALMLCHRVEIQVSRGPIEPLVVLDRVLMHSVFRLREAVAASPDDLEVKIRYLGQLGRTGSRWSTLLSTPWQAQDVLAFVQTQDENKGQLAGIFPAIIRASTLSSAYSVTKEAHYRMEGRQVYRQILASMKDGLPIDSIINNTSSFDKADIFAQLKAYEAFEFVKNGFIPFVLQFMALLMQRLVEVPLSAVIGRRLAAATMSNTMLVPAGVEWLEECLMMVWGQLNLRAVSPMDAANHQVEQMDAAGRAGQLVLAFLGLCINVDVMPDGQGSVENPEQIAFRLIEQWLRLKVTMESYNRPGPHSLSPYPFTRILSIISSAQAGPVVMLNLWGTQCDALLIHSTGAWECICLPEVTEDLATTLQAKLRGELESRSISRGDDNSQDSRFSIPVNDTMSQPEYILRDLWDKVVKPIFDRLKLKPVGVVEEDPPHLTWCLTGPTSFFPLHAAGRYDTQEKGSKAYEYVASSYTPTLSILAHALEARSHAPSLPFTGILAVSQPNTPGQNSIPQTVKEVRTLKEIAEKNGVAVNWLKSGEATKEKVLKGMQASTWVHLACHALQFPLNTSESAFMLADGGLTLAEISENTSASGELAFLSACQTAAGDIDLSEEGVHLAAGMLVAGYSSVIATTWSVRDRDAPIVAGAVYKRLLNGGKVSRAGSALALHHATRLLRESEDVGEKNILHWAPFIHLGV